MRRRRAAWILFAGCGLLVGLLAFAGACLSFGPPREDLAQAFAGRELPRAIEWEALGRRMHAVELGEPERPLVLFVHGTPGEWRDFLANLKDPDLARRAHLVSVDRAGFGGSGFGELETSLARQAALIAPAFARNRSGFGAIVVGHSLGGPIVARLAMDFPRAIGGVVLVAGSIDPALEKRTWYQRLGMLLPIRWMVPRILDLANREMVPLKSELEAMLPLWASVRAPVVVVQGEADSLVPAANADFAARMLTAAEVTMVRVPGQGHLIPWERPDLIRDAIVRLLPST